MSTFGNILSGSAFLKPPLWGTCALWVSMKNGLRARISSRNGLTFIITNIPDPGSSAEDTVQNVATLNETRVNTVSVKILSVKATMAWAKKALKNPDEVLVWLDAQLEQGNLR